MPSVNQTPAAVNPALLKGVRVLVVEDTWHVAKALKSALEQLGMHVAGPAATAADARRLVAAQVPAIALVDINLKRELALELIDDLHERGIRVVVISGYAVPPVEPEKVAVMLQKPFSGAELVAALHAVVGERRLH